MEMEKATKEMEGAYTELTERIAKVFPSEPGLKTAKKYLCGQLILITS